MHSWKVGIPMVTLTSPCQFLKQAMVKILKDVVPHVAWQKCKRLDEEDPLVAEGHLPGNSFPVALGGRESPWKTRWKHYFVLLPRRVSWSKSWILVLTIIFLMHLLWLPIALERSHMKYNFQPAWASASILSAWGAPPPSQWMAGTPALFQYQKKIPPLPVHRAYPFSPSGIVTSIFISGSALCTICNIPTYIFFFLQTVFCGSISCKRAALCGLFPTVSLEISTVARTQDVWSR